MGFPPNWFCAFQELKERGFVFAEAPASSNAAVRNATVRRFWDQHPTHGSRHWLTRYSEIRANGVPATPRPKKWAFSLRESAWRHICVSFRRNIVEKLVGSNIT
jgi:hypothetical protein